MLKRSPWITSALAVAVIAAALSLHGSPANAATATAPALAGTVAMAAPAAAALPPRAEADDAESVADSHVVTEAELAAVDYVVYAIDVGNVASNTANNPYAGATVPYGIDRVDYPYVTYQAGDVTVPEPVERTDNPGFPESLVHGAAPDQEFASTSHLDWGYLPSTAGNPTTFAPGPAPSWRNPLNNWPYFTGRKVDITSAEQAAHLWNDPAYQRNGGVVYRLQVPEREPGAPNAYDLRLGFWFEANNVRVAVDVNGKNRIADQIVVGDVPYRQTLKVTPDADGFITVRVFDPPSVIAGGWVADKSNARLNYLELTAAPKYRTSDLAALLSRTEPRDLRPLQSGVRTARYSSARPVTQDVRALGLARAAAQALVRARRTDATKIYDAFTAVQDAFGAVRYRYHYVAIPGASGRQAQFDSDGNRIQAHGGQIQKIGKTYYWVGEDKSSGVYPVGVHLYSSKELYNWKSEGIVLETARNAAEYAAKVADRSSVFRNYTAQSIATDPDYQAVYGDDFSRFKDDKWQYNIDRPADVAALLEFDLNNAGYVVIERPKVVKNPDGRYVLWYHADGPTRGDPAADSYSKARAGVAISAGTDPTGPYKYLGSFRLDSLRSLTGPDDWGSGYGQSRDMNVFVDKGVDKNDDGADDAYVVYTSDGNGQLYAALLNKTYTGLASWEKCGPDSTAARSCATAGTDVSAGATFNSLRAGQHEAPAPVKMGDTYYLMYSGTSGWVPNGGTYAVADSFLGPYTVKGTPAVGLESSSIFISQSSNIAPIDERKGKYLYIGDQWFNPNHGYVIGNSSYVIQPVTIKDVTLTINRADNWQLKPGRQLGW
jgi:hypothetical protein